MGLRKGRTVLIWQIDKKHRDRVTGKLSPTRTSCTLTKKEKKGKSTGALGFLCAPSNLFLGSSDVWKLRRQTADALLRVALVSMSLTHKRALQVLMIYIKET